MDSIVSFIRYLILHWDTLISSVRTSLLEVACELPSDIAQSVENYFTTIKWFSVANSHLGHHTVVAK